MTTQETVPAALWQDVTRPLTERVDLLLREMTLEEKVAQLGSRWVRANLEPADGDRDGAHVFATGGTALAEAARAGLGHLTRVYGSRPVTPAEGAAELVRQQRVVVDGSRLGVPALVHEECLTGFTTYGATVYPAAIAWAATFDPGLIERMAAAIGRDMAALGVHQGLSPVLDVVRDYRWGRVEETMGEDPYVVSVLGAAYVRGLQGAGVIATLKHFAGYSASRAGRNHGPVSMGRRELMDVVLPPFEAAVTRAGAGSVMQSYSDVDGVPAGADPWLLTDLLRGQWGFTGTVVSDYWALPFLATMHRVAPDPAGAGALALAAGVDVELPDTHAFGPDFLAAVGRGDVPEQLVDRAVRRLLTQKARLGLLDAGWTPEASVAAADAVDLDPPGNRALARELAERSVVLLDAGTALPLTPAVRRIAVVGPCADDPRTFMGCYAFPNHELPKHPGLGLGIEVPSALAALRSARPDAVVSFAAGCSVQGDDRTGFAAAVAAAVDADVCVAFVGDRAGLFGRGTSGEGCDAEDLRLPGVQADLLAALLDTGTPVVVVVVSGRPYALGEVHGRAAGLVQAFLPGEEGGAAIAGVLTGRINPGGKLPVQIPRRPGGQPGTYLQPPLGGANTDISPVDPTPLFPFGHGGSYTTFAVADLRLGATELPTDGSVVVPVAVTVTNTGDRAGDEVVQLYLTDPVAEVVRPVRQLIGFARVGLEPGAAVEVVFHLHPDRTAFTGRGLERIVEAGELRLSVGTSSGDLPCAASLWLTGPTRVVGAERELVTPVEFRFL